MTATASVVAGATAGRDFGAITGASRTGITRSSVATWRRGRRAFRSGGTSVRRGRPKGNKGESHAPCPSPCRPVHGPAVVGGPARRRGRDAVVGGLPVRVATLVQARFEPVPGRGVL